MKQKILLCVYAVLFVVMCVITLQIGPNGDDWFPFSRSLWNLGLQDVYRPAEYYLWVVIAQNFPDTFPWLNHLCVLVCHFVNTILVYKLLKYFHVKDLTRMICAGIFMFSPAIMGAVLSLDGTNQVISSTFSLLGFFAFHKYRNWKGVAGWLLLNMYACMHKELSMTWYVGTPLLSYTIDYLNGRKIDAKMLKSFASICGVGVLAVGAYLLIRINFSLHKELGFGASEAGTHVLTLSPINMIKNLAMLGSTSVTAIDSVSLMGYHKRIWLVALTVMLSLPWLVFLLQIALKRFKVVEQRNVILLMLFFLVTVVSPHLLMAHCGEIHTYSFIVPYIFIVGYLLNEIEFTKKVNVYLGLFVVAMLISDTTKSLEFIDTGSYAPQIRANIEAKTKGNPKNIIVLRVLPDEGDRLYSCFCMTENTAYDSHIFNYALNNWVDLQVSEDTICKSKKADLLETKLAEVQGKYDAVYLVEGTEVECWE